MNTPGRWTDNHLLEHRNMSDSLLYLLLDLKDSTTNSTEKLPTSENGDIDWNEISVAFLIQWSLENSQKITHNHTKEYYESSN